MYQVGSSVSVEDLATMKSLATDSKYPAVRDNFENALRFVDDPAVKQAAVRFLKAMSAVKEAEVVLLWLGPAFVLVCTAILYLALNGFFKGI